MDRRKHPRYDIRLPISFSGPHSSGEGQIVNLSSQGCCVESEVLPAAGSYLDLRVHIPGLDQPLVIQSAAVRWASGREFGIHFLYLTQEMHARLDVYLDILEGRTRPQHHASGQGG